MIKAIFAVDLGGGMGKVGTLPWPKDTEDLNWFKEHTRGHVVVMGSKTWQDPMMPKPLPGRFNVVLSDQPRSNFMQSNAVIPSVGIESELAKIQLDHPQLDIWIIGGARTLLATKHLIKQVVVTEFQQDYDCDIRIDVSSYLNEFEQMTEIHGIGKIFRTYTCKTITTS